jgi:Fe2+ or Zn2+ uptake regulation protein
VQRTMTLNAVKKLASHPTAEEVWQAIAAENPAVSRATVYRNLNRLAENGLLLKIRAADGADHFDHRCDPHAHAICTRCGRVFDIGLKERLDLLGLVGDTDGFEVSGYDLLFTGSCGECRGLDEDK